jgi:cytochrome c biogenesis protein CcmG/thiol:disulfide interchange protein DsbE
VTALREETDGAGPVGIDEPDAPRGGPRAARYTALAVGVVLVALIALLATRQPVDQKASVNSMLGHAMPKVTGTTMDGQVIDLDSFRGKTLVVNFFASWCTECVVEHPELKRFVDEHAAKGDAQVVSVAFGDQPSAVKDYFARNGGNWPVIVTDNGDAAVAFGVTAVPESFVVDESGQIVAHFEGVSAAQLDEVLATFASPAAGADSSSGAAPTTASPTNATPTTPTTPTTAR